MSTVVVTGITGKSGSFFLKRLHQSPPIGYKFRFIVRDPKFAEDCSHLLENIPHEIIIADLNNIKDYDNIFTSKEEKVDVLFHIAGIYFSNQLVTYALRNMVKRIILVHTTGIYSKYKSASNDYLAIERAINCTFDNYKANGHTVSLSILRPTMIYGDLNDRNLCVFIKMTDKLRLFPIINKGNNTIQPVWCKDLGNAYYDFLLSTNTSNKNYVLSGKKPMTTREMLEEIATQLKVKNSFLSVPFWIAYSGSWMLFVLTFGKIDYREKVQRMVEDRAFSHDEASKDFGYCPSSFRDGIQEEIDMYLKSCKKS